MGPRRLPHTGWVCISLLAFTGALLRAEENPRLEAPEGLYATFHTAKGDVTAELFYKRAPMTVLSFVGLAEGVLTETPGRRYFDGLAFHRVVPGFVVQGGDPLGTGEGGPGYAFPDEFAPGLRHDAVGILSMANAGPDTNGSQFFFTLAPVNRLNYLHSVFGRVVAGLDVLPQIVQGDTFTVTIERRGAAAAAFPVTREAFQGYLAAARWAIAPHFADPENVLPLDPPRARGLDNKLANFERFTGHRLYGRLFPTLDPADRDTPASTVVRRLAVEARVADQAVVVAYWVAQDRWALSFPEAWEARFQPEGAAAGAPLAEREAAFFNAARERALAAIARSEAAGQTLTEGQKVKAQWDEVLDGMIGIMEGWSGASPGP